MEKRKFFALATAMAMTAGLLAGCGNTAAPAASGGSAPDSDNAASGGTIKVGLLANTSGGDAVYGNAVKNGAMLYINQVNESGGVNGKQIEVVSYDDKGDPTEAATAFNRMVSDGVTAVIGSVLTSTTQAAADLAYEINMPLITASATAASITMLNPDDPSEGIRENVFRSCFIDPFQGEKMAQYAAEKLSAKTAAVIFETGNDYSSGLKDAFIAKCAELGITVTSEQAFSAGDKDFKVQMTAVAAQQPDVVFCPNYYENDGMIVTQARQVGVTGTFLGGDGWGSVYKYASAEDLEGSVYCSGYAPASNDAVKQFEADYLAAYTDEEKIPNMFAPLGYDAAMLMVNALTEAENAGLAAGSDEYKQAVVDAMKATSGVEGVTGSYAFDEFNNPIKSAAMMRLESGEEVFTELF